MKKKIYALLLILSMVMSLAACSEEPVSKPDSGNDNKIAADDNSDNNSKQTTPSPIEGDGDKVSPTGKPTEIPDSVPTDIPTPTADASGSEQLNVTPTPQVNRDYPYLYDEILLEYRSYFENCDPEWKPWGDWEVASSLRELVMGASEDGQEVLTRTGFALDDISGDGIPELVIGDICSEEEIPRYTQIYAVYTLEGDTPKLVVDGHSRNSYYRGEGNTLLNIGSGGAAYSVFGTYALAPDGLSMTCQDFYYTHEIDGDFENIGCFHNTTGEMTGDASELLDWSLDIFWEIEYDSLHGAIEMELMPLLDYQGVGDASYTESTWLDLFQWDESMKADYNLIKEVKLTDEEGTVQVAFIGGNVYDFSLLKLNPTESGFDSDVVFECGKLNEGEVLIVNLTFYGDIPSWGVSFTDMDGVKHECDINISGEDGSFMLGNIYPATTDMNAVLSYMREGGQLFAEAFLGWFGSDWSYLHGYLESQGYLTGFPYLKDITEDRFIRGEGDELYLIIPDASGLSIAVNQLDENGEVKKILYKSESAEPILIQGNKNTFIGEDEVFNLELNVVGSGNRTLTCRPGVDFTPAGLAGDLPILNLGN